MAEFGTGHAFLAISWFQHYVEEIYNTDPLLTIRSWLFTIQNLVTVSDQIGLGQFSTPPIWIYYY